MAPTDWPLVPISEVAVGIYDGPHATPPKTTEGPVFLGIETLSRGRLELSRLEHLSEEDFIRWTRRVTPQPNDLVFSYETRLGEAALIPHNLRCCLGRRMALIRPNTSKIEPRFLLYYFLSPEFQAVIRSRMIPGSTVDRIPLKEFPTFPVRKPHVSAQKAIASILGALDDKIDLNRRMNQTLEAMGQAIFKSWFVDFDPVHPEQSPQFDRLEMLSHREIPKGWLWRPLGEVIEIHDSKRVPLSYRQRQSRRGPYPYYGAASAMDYIDGYLFDGTYILMGEDGSVINEDDSPVLQYVWGKFWVNNHAHVLSARAGVSLEHLLLFLKQTNIRPFVTGAVQPKLNQGNLSRIPFLYPPPSVSEAFASVISPLFARVRLNTEESRTLAALRDTLLPKLLSGEIRLKQAEKLVGEAV